MGHHFTRRLRDDSSPPHGLAVEVPARDTTEIGRLVPITTIGLPEHPRAWIIVYLVRKPLPTFSGAEAALAWLQS